MADDPLLQSSAAAASHPLEAAGSAPPSAPRVARLSTPLALGAAAVAALGLAGVGLGWQALSRVQELEQELVRRQANSQSLAQDAKQSAQQTQEQVRDLAAKLALAEARLAEVTVQRGQLEELIASLSRSRDENIVGDLEASLRLASQQAQLFGSAEPLVVALRQGDERLQRHKQPRLEGVRRAMLRDLDRVRAVGAVDNATLALRLDEVTRLVDEIPLLSEPHRSPQRVEAAPKSSAPAASASGFEHWRQWLGVRAQEAWAEAKGLLRVTRIDKPEAALLLPEQNFFLRENLKLRLLNARLALMSRQFDAAQADLRAALVTLERYADGRQRRTELAVELLRQVAAQAKPLQLPRPEDSLAALAAVAGVR
ncbi:uroporphyrin-3 C-methyltransferase [Inhella inkyongensis]|uniref:Uroporphyrin-3 C-methyltransferase n=1 Tax=Inhella inkyongensis TaxID=392593 RepID=A0A840S8P2_9BURK|nr:uroporphyrinogen-III C-methyltransferase [Inhella inkyongensis]MBB5206023.1 uroporphyrin-3 C-methyltransferase [Inhella inkyongensis]